MTFTESVSTVLSKYVVFTGRARRSEFWWFVLFSILVNIVAGFIDYILGIQALGFLAMLGLLLPSLGVAVRRLHDTDRSGWWILIGLIPLIGAIVLIVWYASEGSPGENRYGPPAA